MHPKKVPSVTILGLVLVITFIALAILIVALLGTPTSNQDVIPSSYPVSFGNNINVITINPNSSTDFKYTIITGNDTVEMRNNIGDKTIISLDHKEWKDIQWSQDNQLIAALAKTSGGNYDIYVYVIANKSWVQATNYQGQDIGVDKFIWGKDNVLYFTQGVTPNRWLHRFNFVTQNEIVKLIRLDGDIVSISPDRQYIITLINNVYTIYSPEGLKIKDLSGITDDNDQPISIANVQFNTDSTKILLTSTTGTLYKTDLNSSTALLVTTSENLISVCSLTPKIFLGYVLDSSIGNLKAESINIETEAINPISVVNVNNLQSISAQQSICFEDNNLLLKTKYNDLQTKWLRTKDGGFEEMAPFQNAVEVSVVN